MYLFRAFIAGAVLCAALLARTADAMPVKTDPCPPLPTTDDREMMVREPVFGGTVYVSEAGRSHPSSVVLVHGLGEAGAHDWDALVPVLAAKYHVVTFDLPGFGRSERGNALYSPGRYARFVKWVAGEYVKGPFVLIGHSLGGAIALRYAADYPGDLRRLILVDAAGILYRISLLKEMVREKNEADEGDENAPASKRAEGFSTFLRFALDNVANDRRGDRLRKALESGPMRSVVLGGEPKKIAALALMMEDFSRDVERVRTPSLLVWGENDAIAPLRTGRALAGRLPGARLIVIPDSGHVPMREQAAEFNRIIADELAGRQTATVSAAPRPDRSGRVRSGRVGKCSRRAGMVFTGRYERIELDRCDDAAITDATVGRIAAKNSEVIITNSIIRGRGAGLTAQRSEIVGTNVTIEADIAIHASRSHLDFAGAKLRARKTIAETDNKAVILFSISHADSPGYSGPLHGSRTITRRKPL